MELLENLFHMEHKNNLAENAVVQGQHDVADEGESGSEEEEDPPLKQKTNDSDENRLWEALAPMIKASRRYRRSRPDRGKFTILDSDEVADMDEILQIDFDMDLLQKIFKDSRVGIQFLARYGIIPNTRECRIHTCPKEQLMSLIKHANGYVWRCRSCRKRRERRVITKISVYEGTFLFYSRMPLNKFFIFMLVWCENPGNSASEYNRLLGEYRLVEETIYNTIGFIRDHIQSWCMQMACSGPIGGEGKCVELLETFHTEDISAKHRNRRDRQFSMKIVLICWQTEQILIVDLPEKQFSDELLEFIVKNNVRPGSTVVMKDVLMDRFGDQEQLQRVLGSEIRVATISDIWMETDEMERDKQYVKTLMSVVQTGPMEPFAYEYFFRRRFIDKPFNNLLKAIRQLYENQQAPLLARRNISLPNNQ